MRIFSVHELRGSEREGLRALARKNVGSKDAFEEWDRPEIYGVHEGDEMVVFTPGFVIEFAILRIHHYRDSALLSKVVRHFLERPVLSTLAVLVDLAPWSPHRGLELYPAAELDGTAFTTARLQPEACGDPVGVSLSTVIDVGAAQIGDKSVVWHPRPVPIEMRLTNKHIDIHFPLLVWPARGEVWWFVHVHWMGQDVLEGVGAGEPDPDCQVLDLSDPLGMASLEIPGDGRFERSRMWSAGRLLGTVCQWEEGLDLYHFTLAGIPMRQQFTEWEQRKNTHLRRAYAVIFTRARHAAYTIQRCWKRAVSDPGFAVARRRLQREFEELQSISIHQATSVST